MVTKSKSRKSFSAKKRFIGKPTGQIQSRVQSVGPEHFGIVSVDCAKRRSKWLFCDFYGRVLIEPTSVEHTGGTLSAMTALINDAIAAEAITDCIVAVEMTGIYHRPVQRAFRKAGFDTRIVHPFASKHFHKPLHPGQKSDDNDLEAIFHAAINGYGLATLSSPPTYQSRQAVSRHRHNLVKQQARLKVQIRRLLHMTMPGYADLWEDDKLFTKSIALPVASKYVSAEAISKAGVATIAAYLKKHHTRYQVRTLDRIVAWSRTAADASELSEMYTRQWQELNQVRELIQRQIDATEREMAGFLVQTPYVLLLSVTGINVVSASRFAGEAGPIEHYASARAITGRAGLYGSRYQSDEVDHADGSLVRQCNRKLRGAAMLIAENLIKCHSYYRGLSALWENANVDARDRRVRIASRAMRMVFQLVSGRQVWRGHGVDCDYILDKLREFHRVHKSPVEQSITEMTAAVQWLPKSSYAAEAKPLEVVAAKKQRGPKPISDLLIPLLARLGVGATEEVESNMSEARGSD